VTFYIYLESGYASDAESEEDAVAEASAGFIERLQKNEVAFLVEEDE
jgi:hypothetical protein